MTAQTVAPAAVTTAAGTLADLILNARTRYGDLPAFEHKTGDGQWTQTTFSSLVRTAEEISAGLLALGIRHQERIALLSDTRPEWSYVHYGVLLAGAALVPLFPSSSADEIRHILQHSEASLIVVETPEHLARIRGLRDGLPRLRHVVTVDQLADGLPSLARLRALGGDVTRGEREARLSLIASSDTASIIYTSGTTGLPKGCMLDHRAWKFTATSAVVALDLQPGESGYLFLPLAHAFAHLVELIALEVGGKLIFWDGDLKNVPVHLAERRPHYFPSVPRLFEKFHARIVQSMQEAHPLRRALFNWSVQVGLATRGRTRPGPLARARLAAADALVLKKVRGILGGRIKRCVTGAAPISPEILDFFRAVGIHVLESYGMTEAPAITTNRPGSARHGAVGRPLPGMQVRIAEDGEILVAGPGVFSGYFRAEDETAATIRDGWLYTGDLGRLDEDGYLYITGRKKEILITAGGKNVAPGGIESALRQQPFVSQAVLCGDRRPFVGALIAVDMEELTGYASRSGWQTDDLGALLERPELQDAVRDGVRKVNATLSRAAQIRRFQLLPAELSQDRGELTPTLKVKRRVVLEHYGSLVEDMYDGGGSSL